MNPKRSRSPRESGFSLIEVLIAVTIIVLMGGVVAWNIVPLLADSKRDRAELDIKNLKTAIKLFNMKEHRIPHDSEWPSFLLQGSENHPDPYLDADDYPDGEINDPWQTPYAYRRHTSREYEIISYGADGVPGGEGDDADISSKKSKN